MLFKGMRAESGTVRSGCRRAAAYARGLQLETLERRNMPALVIDVGHHFVDPDSEGQVIHLAVESTEPGVDSPVTGLDLRVEIADAADLPSKPVFEGLDFDETLWDTIPHTESGGVVEGAPSLAEGQIAGSAEAAASGRLVSLSIDTTGIFSGSFPLVLEGTAIGSTELVNDGEVITVDVSSGTLQVRSVWQNPSDPLDIDGDGSHSPRDVLFLVSEMNDRGSGDLPPPSPGNQPPPFVDVNGDGKLTAIDILRVVNCINFGDCPDEADKIPARPAPVEPPADDNGDGDPQDENPGDEQPDDTPPVDESDPGGGDNNTEDHEPPAIGEGEAVDLALGELLSEGDANPLFDSFFDL